MVDFVPSSNMSVQLRPSPGQLCYFEPHVHDHNLYFLLNAMNIYALAPIAAVGVIVNCIAFVAIYRFVSKIFSINNYRVAEKNATIRFTFGQTFNILVTRYKCLKLLLS